MKKLTQTPNFISLKNVLYINPIFDKAQPSYFKLITLFPKLKSSK